ncbi:MipA/OmpV family protein [Hasllibacter sp. MH4015]|uniref:MipA/OmpV family protein n=1 Tax=Hasllibacter sp. MH4015 TaxID=2854029 RepID=UPI001CD4AD27|nr:MipA/OmpV family protein [Hasllibacter sp. MH4015]
MTKRVRLMAFAAAFAAMTGGAASAEGPGITASLGFGGQVMPDYFGADSYRVRPLGFGQLHELEIGPIARPDTGPREGFGFRGAFRISHARLAEDNAELVGLEDVPFSVELGGGVGYATEAWRVFGDVRYGVIGHNTFVGEIGGDVIFRPSDSTTITLGPRVQIASDDYAQTYFGITAAEAAASVSGFGAYDAEGGVTYAGLQLNIIHALNDDWSVRGRLELGELQGSAADSPIVQNGDTFQARAGVTLVRRFTLGF